jgi:3-hydroxymyristoyl/3-hydroxydecanoyl-(acyl carrier protein) dehydratase
VFVEHGPRNLCSGWISATLHDRDHLTVALDDGGDSLAALATAVAELTAAGVCVNPGPVLDRLAPAPPAPPGARPRSLVTPAHPPLVTAALARPPFTGPPPDGAAPEQRRPPPGHRTAEVRPRVTTAPPQRSPRPLDRAQLERRAAGQVTTVPGDRFADIGKRARHPRLPEAPMLLVDRVLDIDAEPGSPGQGIIRTETDIHRDAWYVDGCGRLPAGLLVEAGQGYLLLTRLGADRLVPDGHGYRILGCDLTFRGSPPPVGTTVRCDITVDDQVEHDGVHLVSFHSRCDVDGERRLVVAGCFTDEEIAASEGVLWHPGGARPPQGRWSEPAATTKTSFGFTEIRAFAEGRPDLCFGKGWEITRAHLRTPRTGDGRLQLLHRVPVFDPCGGPWKRGYLRAEFDTSPQEWFFSGHFTDDPGMPGTLVFEACLQAMAFYLAGCGYTLDRDGWRFEPVPDETFRLRFRGQVTPHSGLLTYELFVSEIADSPEPTLFADALCTVDGVQIFHVRRLGLRLAPDWPLTHWSGLAAPATQPPGEPLPPEHLGGLLGHSGESGADGGEPRYGYPELLAAAWGPPARRDGSPSIRLPGPPYLFTSRISDVVTTSGGVGSTVLAEYAVPERAWFWGEGRGGTAPVAVLAEIALQPCSWLLEHLGLPRDAQPGVRLRNLGGSLTSHRELRPSDDVVRTTARLTGVADRAGTTVCTFDVACRVGEEPLLTLETTFGLLPAGDRSRPSAASPVPEEEPVPEHGGPGTDLRTRPRHLFDSRPRLPGPMLLMIDRVTGFWPDGGAAGLGRLRAEKDLGPGHWSFKAHVFQDPVLPGTLALEAATQLLQLHLLGQRAAGDRGTRFETPAAGRELTWVHHGEVLPTSDRIVVDLEITGTATDATGQRATADARLYVGRACVCQVRGVDVRTRVPKATKRHPATQKGDNAL